MKRMVMCCIQFSLATTIACTAATASERYTFTMLASFDFINGANPFDSLIADANGNLYGTTYYGGTNGGWGTVFQVAGGTHSLSTLIAFDGTNGASPIAGLVADANGNLYGTAGRVVFKVASGTHTLTTLATFTGGNGDDPQRAMIIDANGNLYGTTYDGGTDTVGTVFKVAAGTHTLTTLVSFNGSNGKHPVASLLADTSNNLYGTTTTGGTGGSGTVFKIAADTNVLSELASFDGTNGATPFGGLIADANGNLYGTTTSGGANGFGTVFEIAADTHQILTLATFDKANGANPYAGLIADVNGNLYGTTAYGGTHDDGTVFEVANDANHTLTTLFSFDGVNGSEPFGGLIADPKGNLYGTTDYGGLSNNGTVFELSPVPEPSSILLGGLAVGGMSFTLRKRLIRVAERRSIVDRAHRHQGVN